MHYYAPSGLLDQKIILVTGASDGIGRQAAQSFAHYGAKVIILGRTESKLKEAEQQLIKIGNPPIFRMIFDFLSATPEQYQQLAQQIAEQVTHLDGLLHSAGILGEIARIDQQSPEIWQQVMQVNVNAQFMLTQALLPLLLNAKRASIIFSSSSVGRQGRRCWGAYSVSKFATEGLMQVLADEYQNTSLRFNCINPGGTRTSMRATAFPNEAPNTLKTPLDIMPTYLYLMGDDSIGINGKTLDAQPKQHLVAI